MPDALPDLTPLTPDQCPLLTRYGGPEAARLLGKLGDAINEVNKVAADRQLGPLLAIGKFNDALEPLIKARALMTRKRYVVGCIGVSQAGKSTTINHVLGEEACKSGSGDATSSQPSRIVYDDTRSLDVEFLDPPRFAERRRALCEAIGLATPPDDNELLPKLDKPELFRPTDGPEPGRLREDLAYLRQFLNAYLRNRQLVKGPPPLRREGLSYDKRYDYTTHTKGGPGAEVLLIREAGFRVDNKRIPAELELCDLPGLDSKRTVDDLVTWEYLPELNGTLLFVNVAMNLLSEGMLKILARINKHFDHNLAGRAWVVFTKMDGLSPNHYRPGEDNIFATIKRFLEKTEVPESQVCLASNDVWPLAVASGGTADRAQAAARLKQSPDKPVPDMCPPGLRSAWEELLKDGGISYISRLILTDVAQALAKQIRQDVDKELDRFTAGFAARVSAERKRLTMGATELQAAFTCYSVVLQLKVTLGARLSEFPILIQEGERLRASLTGVFEKNAPPELLANLSPRELADHFDANAKVLTQQLEAELTTEVIDKVYQVVGQRLEGLPPVLIGPAQQVCKDVWAGFGLGDRLDGGWQAGLPRFDSEDVMRWIVRDAVEGDVYAELMRGKIDVAVRQTVHLLRTQLRQRLGEIVKELSLLTGKRETATAT